MVVVLHALQGLTQDEAARQIGCSDRTFRRRWVRSCNLLRRRLVRRGLAPAAGTLASTLAPAPASAGITEAATDALVEAAMSFAAGTVPAATSAVILARGVIQAMLWNKLKASAIAAGLLLALGAGLGVGLATPLASASGKNDGQAVKEAAGKAADPEPSPADQYRALVKRYEAAQKIYSDAVEGKTVAEELEIYERLGPKPDDHVPAFVALAVRYPDDPVAFDALHWAIENTLSSGLEPGGRSAQAVERAMEILARDHAGDPRLGPFCFRMLSNLSPRNEAFMKNIAERSPNRVVKGQATFALAESLKRNAMWLEIHRRPDAPESIAMLRAHVRSDFLPEDATDQEVSDRAAQILQNIKSVTQETAKEVPEERPATSRRPWTVILRRSAASRTGSSPGCLPNTATSPMSEVTAAPPARLSAKLLERAESPDRPSCSTTDVSGPSSRRSKPRIRGHTRREEAAGEGEAGEKAFHAAVPKWADFGPKMWRWPKRPLAARPRSTRCSGSSAMPYRTGMAGSETPARSARRCWARPSTSWSATTWRDGRADLRQPLRCRRPRP